MTKPHKDAVKRGERDDELARLSSALDNKGEG